MRRLKRAAKVEVIGNHCVVAVVLGGICPMIEVSVTAADAVALVGSLCMSKSCRRLVGVWKQTIVEWPMMTAKVACDD